MKHWSELTKSANFKIIITKNYERKWEERRTGGGQLDPGTTLNASNLEKKGYPNQGTVFSVVPVVSNNWKRLNGTKPNFLNLFDDRLTKTIK